MDLRDVVGALVELDDEQRALTNELHRSLDALARALKPFGVDEERIAQLREQWIHGLDASRQVEALADELATEVGSRAWELRSSESEKSFREALNARLAEWRTASRALDRIAELVGSRGELQSRLSRLKRDVDPDEETTELLEIVLAAREAVLSSEAGEARAFLDDAMTLASNDGQLSGTASILRALREALATGEDPSAIVADLSARVVDLCIHLGQAKEEARRRLAALERDAERRQEVSHGYFQAITKASEVLDLTARLKQRLDDGGIPDGALGPLKAACIENGVVSLLLELRRLSVDRDELDQAMQDLSASLGGVFVALAQDGDRIEPLGRIWEDLAAVDAGAIEAAWEDAYAEVLGVERRDGVVSVEPEGLAVLAGADGLDPWLQQLERRLDQRVAESDALVERLERADEVLTQLLEGDDAAARAAVQAKGCLTRFVGEVTHAAQDYHERVRSALLDPESGFRRVQSQVSGFTHAEELAADAAAEERRAAFDATLEEVRELFTELEAHSPGGDDPEGWRRAEEAVRRQVSGAYRDLAAVLAKLRRLRELVLPPLSESSLAALAFADEVAKDAARSELDAEAIAARTEEAGEQLESLHGEKLLHESFRLPSSRDVRATAALSRERDQRLLNLQGASVVLLFELLRLVAMQYEELSDEQRAAHLSWMDELLVHARKELEEDLSLLEHFLPLLDDNAARLERYLRSFDAYHRWAMSTADSEAGLDLMARHDKQLFHDFEKPLAGVGAGTLVQAESMKADWTSSALVESVAEFLRLVEDALKTRPTSSRVQDSILLRREEALALKDKIAAEAEAESESGPGPLFG